MESAFIKTIMPDTLKDKIKEMERDAILKALEECDWIQAKAARKLGITERMIGYKINKYGIRKETTGELPDVGARRRLAQ
jgi:transcriptional regulator with GAF, ATPase, and Fis domain